MHKCLVAASLLVVTSIGVAEAQSPNWPPPTGPECQPSPGDVSRSKALYQLGATAHGRGDYETAISYYHDAYLFDCRAHLLLSNISKAYEAQGKYTQALEALRLYEARAKPTGTAAADLAARMTSLARRAVEMHEGPAPDSSQAAASSASALAPPAPSVSASASPPTPPPSRSPVLTPPAPHDGTHSSAVPALITMGVGGAIMLTGGVLAIIGASNASQISDVRTDLNNTVNCWQPADDPACSAEYNRLSLRGQTAEELRNTGLVVIGIGGLTALGGALWWYFSAPKKGETATASATTVRLTSGPSPVGFGLAGSF